jgi:hypothetical protein
MVPASVVIFTARSAPPNRFTGRYARFPGRVQAGGTATPGSARLVRVASRFDDNPSTVIACSSSEPSRRSAALARSAGARSPPVLVRGRGPGSSPLRPAWPVASFSREACTRSACWATARKDRTSSEHADLVAAKVERGELVVSVPDYALCVHTRAGQEMGRGLTQWWEDGALVSNELETADHSYRDELIEIHRAAEDNGTAGRES